MKGSKYYVLTLQLVGFDWVDMDNFNNRLIYQKVIYLMQNFGLSLGYGYSWYVKGPYSPDLRKPFLISPLLFLLKVAGFCV